MSRNNRYSLDKEDFIISVGPDWDAFASENGGASVTCEKVLGRKLWDFVEGFQTKSYLNAIFFACRMDSAGFEISYRCDAPEIKRLFRLTITPQDDGVLVLDHMLVHTKHSLAQQKVTSLTQHFDQTRCTICCSFLIGENWIDTFDRADERYFAKSYGICPKCRAAARQALVEKSQRGGNISPMHSGK